MCVFNWLTYIYYYFFPTNIIEATVTDEELDKLRSERLKHFNTAYLNSVTRSRSMTSLSKVNLLKKDKEIQEIIENGWN